MDCNCHAPDTKGALCYEHGMREHTTRTNACWCQPSVVPVPPNGEVIVHKRTADGYEPPVRPTPDIDASADRRGGWPF